MAAAPTKIPVGLAGDSSLRLGDRLDDDVRFAEQIIEATARDRASAGVDDNRRIEEICGRNSAFSGSVDSAEAGRGLGFIMEDRAELSPITGQARLLVVQESAVIDRSGLVRQMGGAIAADGQRAFYELRLGAALQSSHPLSQCYNNCLGHAFAGDCGQLARQPMRLVALQAHGRLLPL